MPLPLWLSPDGSMQVENGNFWGEACFYVRHIPTDRVLMENGVTYWFHFEEAREAALGTFTGFPSTCTPLRASTS